MQTTPNDRTILVNSSTISNLYPDTYLETWKNLNEII